jgi:hypothetical protein
MDLNLVQIGDDFSPNIRINKLFRNFEMFSKDIKILVASDESDKRNGSVWDVINFR